MTCFWDGLLRALPDALLRDVLGTGARSPTLQEFVRGLVARAAPTPDVTWQGETLSARAQEENLAAVRALRPAGIRQGYLCSACDPFLLHVAQLFHVDIHHDFNGAPVAYAHRTVTAAVRLRVCSNRGHFWPC